MMKLTFKKRPRSKGLAGIGEGVWIDVKHKGKKFAIISGGGSGFSQGYTIQIAFKNSGSWDWHFIARDTLSIKNEEQAKQILQDKIDGFVMLKELHFFEDLEAKLKNANERFI